MQPRVGHDNAIVWNILRPVGAGQGAEGGAAAPGPEQAKGFDPEAQAANVLQRITGVARHALQAGKRSDYHAHADAEQLYYVLRGQGKMIVDDETYAIREGDVIYLPPGVKHRAVNDSDDWMEHVIVTAKLG